MPKKIRYLFDHWKEELIELASSAMECCVASAYMSQEGVKLLTIIAKKLAHYAKRRGGSLIKVILSDQFTLSKKNQIEILNQVNSLPGVEVRIYSKKGQLIHWKNFIFYTSEYIKVIIGSLNITGAGLFSNLEDGALITHQKHDPEIVKLKNEFDEIWNHSIECNQYIEKVEKDLIAEPKFSRGDNVIYLATGKIGTINSIIEGSRGYSYKVTIDGERVTIPEDDLKLFIDTEDEILNDFNLMKFGDHSDYKLFHLWIRFEKPIENNLYSYLGSKTILNYHQFKPLLRFLSPYSFERLFIADEVGVGKTIESGIILKELFARDILNYRSPILIVCPKALCSKWQKEMKERFSFNFNIFTGMELQTILTMIKEEGIFPEKNTFGIVGLQTARYETYYDLFKEIEDIRDSPIFEMIIIDEAHHMRNPTSMSYKLGKMLSNLTERLLMLSATPLNLKSEDLFNQMHILNPSLFPDLYTFEILQAPVKVLNRITKNITENTQESRKKISELFSILETQPLGKNILSHMSVRRFMERLKVPNKLSKEEIARFIKIFISLSPFFYSFTRTRKREAFEHQVQREAWYRAIILSSAEKYFMDSLMNIIKEYHLSRGIEPQALGLTMNTYRLMTSSCIPASIEYLKENIEREEFLMSIGDLPEDPEDETELSTKHLESALKSKFENLLEEVEELQSELYEDSKYKEFFQVVRKILSNEETPQIIVFSFFTKTLDYLKSKLETDGFKVGLIHGRIPEKGDFKNLSRDEIMEAFKRGEYQILLSSEIGGEGLDFQFCRAIINYDLPYNPMRVEQRIGRIDRFGQKAEKIIIVNLFIKGTVDEEIYNRLYLRIRLVEDSVGSLEPILGRTLSNLQSTLISGTLTEEQKEEQQKRIEDAIVKAKIQYEEFEKSRKELLGDDYLTEPITNLSRTEHISPNDILELTTLCFSRWEGCSIKKLNDDCAKITLSEVFISKMKKFYRKPGNEGAISELHKIETLQRNINIVFNGNNAENYPDYIFLSPTGYWTRFLLSEMKEQELIKYVFTFTAKDTDIKLDSGKYLIFIFEVTMEGIKTEIEILGVPISIEDKKYKTFDISDLPRRLANIVPVKNIVVTNNFGLDDYLIIAREMLENILDGKKEYSSEENKYRVESRMTSLENSCKMKIQKLEERITNHIKSKREKGQEPDERYIKSTKTRIENERYKTLSKLKELEKQSILSLNYNLQSIILLNVINP